LSRADAIRQAYANPAVKASIDQEAAAQRKRAASANTRKLRALTADAGPDMDELALDALAARIAALITIDPQTNSALIREMLPAYLASRPVP
jgi:hypothetical protein